MRRLFSYSLVVLLGLAFVIPSTSSLSAGTLKVTTPNAGQAWTVGKKYVIKWDKGNAGRELQVVLVHATLPDAGRGRLANVGRELIAIQTPIWPRDPGKGCARSRCDCWAMAPGRRRAKHG